MFDNPDSHIILMILLTAGVIAVVTILSILLYGRYFVR